jgi:signal transduction histidine kinase
MKTLALRIYLAVVAVLMLFALVTGWLAQRNFEREREHLMALQSSAQASARDRAEAWVELIENSLPDVGVDEAMQRDALLDWSQRLRLPMALDNTQGVRIATSPLLTERLVQEPDHAEDRLYRAVLADGRVLWLWRPGFGPRARLHGPPPPTLSEWSGVGRPPHRHDDQDGGRPRPHPREDPWLTPLAWMLPPGWAGGAQGLGVMLVLVFVAVALAAWPVANRLTRRLQALRHGVEQFGQGHLQHRVEVEGKDEVADVARSFNQAAQRIEELITAHRSLLANASHELRSPLARMKMALSMMNEMPADRAEQLKAEIHEDIRELDALVEEVLLASRLDARAELDLHPVELLGMLTEEAQRTGAEVVADPSTAQIAATVDERLLRRAVRNLLENAKRYGHVGAEPAKVELALSQTSSTITITVSDRGPGVPAEQRERIFEPFYRLPGHAEHAGGVGLGLSLVRQIVQRHGGLVLCHAREGGGSHFIIELPKKNPA